MIFGLGDVSLQKESLERTGDADFHIWWHINAPDSVCFQTAPSKQVLWIFDQCGWNDIQRSTDAIHFPFHERTSNGQLSGAEDMPAPAERPSARQIHRWLDRGSVDPGRRHLPLSDRTWNGRQCHRKWCRNRKWRYRIQFETGCPQRIRRFVCFIVEHGGAYLWNSRMIFSCVELVYIYQFNYIINASREGLYI